MVTSSHVLIWYLHRRHLAGLSYFSEHQIEILQIFFPSLTALGREGPQRPRCYCWFGPTRSCRREPVWVKSRRPLVTMLFEVRATKILHSGSMIFFLDWGGHMAKIMSWSAHYLQWNVFSEISRVQGQLKCPYRSILCGPNQPTYPAGSMAAPVISTYLGVRPVIIGTSYANYEM